jgi:hypothetical protein
LYGLKENVIIGKLIPAGTGFISGRFKDDEAGLSPAQLIELSDTTESE